jgi:hypothetical protein
MFPGAGALMESGLLPVGHAQIHLVILIFKRKEKGLGQGTNYLIRYLQVHFLPQQIPC